MCESGNHAVPFWLKTLLVSVLSLQQPLGREMDDGQRGRSRSRHPPRDRERSLSEITGGRKGPTLKRTSGLRAAGAWEARNEIADMIERGVDPNDILALIRQGEEETELEVRSGHERESSAPTLSAEDDQFDEWEIIRATQKSIVETMGGEDVLPPWARSGEPLFQPSSSASGSRVPGSAKTRESAPVTVPRRTNLGPPEVEAPRDIFGENKVGGFTFQKRAKPPPKESYDRSGQARNLSQEDLGPPPRGVSEGSSDPIPLEDSLRFAKKAKKPPEGYMDPPKEIRTEGPRTSKRYDSSMTDREKSDLERYYKDTYAIYSFFRREGVAMDLGSIVDPDKEEDLEKFRLLTAPNRASTGLGYARLMRRHINWKLDRGVMAPPGSSPDLIMGLLDYIIFLTQKEVGFMTPRSFMYAWEYYSRAFGYVADGPHWGRAKRLCGQYAQAREGGVSKAPAFTRATMLALERIVLDETMWKTHRVAAGKLRLCVQASIRHSDLQNTPLHLCEWIRKPKATHVVGLRSKARRGKTGPRLWVASLRGADPVGDGWLEKLMALLIESHGTDWSRHDFTGRMPSHVPGEFLNGPSKIEVDVTTVKEALIEYKEKGGDIGLSDTELSVLRWHGAKASMSSIMQHLNIPPRVVRVQGAWRFGPHRS